MSMNRTDKIQRRYKIFKSKGLCTLCPLRGGENMKARHRKRNHGQQPTYKDKR